MGKKVMVKNVMNMAQILDQIEWIIGKKDFIKHLIA